MEVDNKMPQEKAGRAKGTAYVLISAVLFSLGGALIKGIPWSPVSINGTRSVLSLAVILIYMAVIKHKLVLNKTVLFGGACNFAMSLTFVMATKMTSAANAIVLQFTEPIFVILIMWLYFGKRPKRDAAITCLIVFAGILCFFFDKLSAGGLVGNLLAIFSGLAYAIVFLTKSFEDGDFESSLVLALIFCIAAGIPGFAQETEFSLRIWLCLAALGVLQFGVSFIFLSKGLDYVSPVAASLTSTIEPILNPVLVAIFFGETIGWVSILGAVLVIGASTFYNVRQAASSG